MNKDYLTVGGRAPPYGSPLEHLGKAYTPFMLQNVGKEDPLQFLSGLAMPMYGETNEQKAAQKEAGKEKAKETRQQHLEEDPLYYYHRRHPEN